ncbi:hypothetical protein D9615_007186 [Tricholomella constricta]|uniref:RNase H type-1 domain-containing protein n=1 Tax=Tricholomella constricta TaxID=117010 RepID=A0A8H5H8Y8_9AGAR|nr:hypothetical protein D9615_007186 [Tricholomella constricta]
MQIEARRQLGNGDTGLPTEPAAQPPQTASTITPTNEHHTISSAPNAHQQNNVTPGTHQPRTITDYFNPPTQSQKKKILRANIRIGSYNIRGGGSRQTSNKWEQINQVMRDNKIGILAVQETHLTRAEVNRLNGLFEKRLLIINSSLHRRTNAAGVAIILNKQWTAWDETHHWEVVPGRALLVQIPWKNSRETTRTILAIYAPNDPAENKELWVTLQRAFRNNRLPNPDFMIGDFNIVEDALDRIPAHEDDANAVEELRTLKSQLNLMDGWRAENGDEKAYSYLQSTTFSQSRIDRIYINPELFPSTREWEISHDISLSDHNLVSVQYFDPGAPKIGRGRWSIPQYAVDDEKFIKDIKPLLDRALKPVGTPETPPEPNPQRRLKNLKDEIIELARKYVSKRVPESKKKIAAREIELKKVLNDPSTSEEFKKERAAELETEMRKLQLHHHLSTRERTHLKFAKESELIGKTWINVNKEIRGRDQILALQKPDSVRGGLVYNSTKMAEIARKYHSEIQSIGRCYDAAKEEREKAIEEALNALETKLTDEESDELNTPLTSSEIRRAIYDSANEKSPGLDGIPTEIWKELTRNPEHIKEDEEEEEIWDAARLLRDAYNNVIEYGILQDTDFASGWMSPIFKKKDKTKIENYRPITVLNADYKIMTKTLTARITAPALKLIHTDQAGFMKGRRIENQTDLIRTMIEYGQNGEAKAKNIPTQYGPPDERSAINCFTQKWEAAKQSKKSAAPLYVREMIKTSRKYGLRLWTNAPSENAKRSLPIWLHVASKRTRAASDANNLWAKCQRDNHKLSTVGDMADYASGPECQTQARTTPDPDPNPQAQECQCRVCSHHRAINCTDPQACRRSAKKLLLSLRKTWIPNPERDEVDELTREKSEGYFPLNRADSVAECFRIFTTSEAPSLTLDEDLGKFPHLHTHDEDEFTSIYTDGSGIGIDTIEAAAGGGVFFEDDDPRNEAFRLPISLPQTNNAAEAAAILAAVNKVNRDAPIIINSDSQITIKAITQLATKIEDSGWIETSNREILEPLFALLRTRSASTIIKKVKAHSGIHGNERADSLAGEGAAQPISQIILPLTPINEATTQGVRLSTATQGLLYKGIRKIKASKTKARRQTTCHLDIARHEIAQRTGKLPTDKAIWTSLKKGHLLSNKRARQLIWKLMHHGLPIGEFWNSITNYEHRAECRECGTTESPEHIFTECKFSGQETIWKSVKTIFENKNIPWIAPSLGTVMGCGISELTNELNGQKRPAADRLYTIVIAEATQLIWRTRCDWRMEKGEDPLLAQTVTETHNKWAAHLNKVLHTDILSSNYKPHKNINKARMNLPTEESVIETWWDVVTDNSELEWEVKKKSRRRKVGVLVGNAT